MKDSEFNCRNFIAKSKSRAKPIQHEEKMCMDFIKLLTLDRTLRKYKPYIFHQPNSGKRSAATGAKMKAMGTMKGAADYEVMKPVITRYISADNLFKQIPYSKMKIEIVQNLYLEFKYGKNKQSPEQKEFEKMVTSCGHLYKVVYSIEAAILEIKKFWGDE